MTKEEAIERIKSRYYKWTLDNKDLEAIASFIPELAESEDERIREEMIEYFSQYKEDGLRGVDITPWIAYLERQKKQKPAEWGELDSLYRDNLIAYLNLRKDKNLPEDTKYPVLDAWIDWLKSLPQRIVPQPSLSKEDFVKFGNLEYERGKQDGIQSAERVCWKPSEQEKGAIRTAIHILIEERAFPKAAAQLQNILNTFEGKESRKDWKPSEEEIKALKNVVETYRQRHNVSVGGDRIFVGIESLYNKLSNLQQ